MVEQVNELIKAKNADKVSEFDIELLDATLAILTDMEMTTENRFLSGLVLVSHEFKSEQIESFLPQFLIKMTQVEMKVERFNALVRHTETEKFITKIIDTESTPDFIKQFFIPTSEKVSVNSDKYYR